MNFIMNLSSLESVYSQGICGFPHVWLKSLINGAILDEKNGHVYIFRHVFWTSLFSIKNWHKVCHEKKFTILASIVFNKSISNYSNLFSIFIHKRYLNCVKGTAQNSKNWTPLEPPKRKSKICKFTNFVNFLMVFDPHCESLYIVKICSKFWFCRLPTHSWYTFIRFQI